MFKSKLQNATQKTNDWAARTSLKIGDDIRCSGRVSSITPLVTPVVLLLL